MSLSTYKDTGRPFGAVLSHEGKVVGGVGYLSYQTLDTVPEGLFAPPAGVEIRPAL